MAPILAIGTYNIFTFGRTVNASYNVYIVNMDIFKY